MKFRHLAFFLLLANVPGQVRAQLLNGEPDKAFTRADSLRGTLSPLRSCYDVGFYRLDIKVDLSTQSISGRNTIRFKVTAPFSRLQLDLYENMKIDKIVFGGKSLPFQREFNAVFVQFPGLQPVGAFQEIEVIYGGKPTVAKRAPWDGGFVWTKDKQGKPWVGVACQGAGASLWWPCKDHQSDEPDSMQISVTAPKGLMNVSNGRLRSKKTLSDGSTRFDWFVSYPINTYDVTVNLADYATFSDTHRGAGSNSLSLDYYVLKENLNKAKKQFAQVKPMLACFEKYFGPYPFYRDGYKLVETPYLGMEHQSAVAYGNGYQQGYLGAATSAVGLKFDYIIIHESGHEWWGNSVTSKDMADMWIHESFTNYSESLFTEYYYGKNAGAQYVIGCRANIRNDLPIIGTYNVNKAGSGDMYFKGGNMLHTIRQLVGDDERWRQILRGLNETFYHQTVTTDQIEQYMIRQTGRNLKPVFNQYLRDVRIPVLEYRLVSGGVQYRWANCVAGFDMPVQVCLNEVGPYESLKPTSQWKTLTGKNITALTPDANYYVLSKLVR